MEKLDLQTFRELKQEVIEYIGSAIEAEKRGEYLSEEDSKRVIERYKEIIKILSEHDLSDIDFEEWRGMHLVTNNEIPIDFSKTKANLDFSIIEYENYDAFPNLKSCQIKNFNFGENEYTPDMFDEEYIKENEKYFVSDSVPKDVADRFYKGELTLTDIQNNIELANKIEEKNISYGLRYIYKKVGREEFCKLDAEFIDSVENIFDDFLKGKKDLHTADEIMPVLYKEARSRIIEYNESDPMKSFYHTQNDLGFKFKEQNPDLFLSEDAPEHIQNLYYHHGLSLLEYSSNLKYFEGKIVSQAFYRNNESAKKLIGLYGEEIYQLFRDYKPIMDELIKYPFFMQEIEIPNGTITEEQRKEIMVSAISEHFKFYEYIGNMQVLRMLMDFIPLDLINMGRYGDLKKDFIKKYGIDNIITLDEETKGIFSHQSWEGDIYLTVFAMTEPHAKEFEVSPDMTYEKFKNRMFEILSDARNPGGILYGKAFSDYDFIQGEFRKEHQEIFLDGDIDSEIKKAFYLGKLKAEDVRTHPELIESLKGKKLKNVFSQEMAVGISLSMRDKEGKNIGGIPNIVNMAQYISEKIGQEEFLKICADYGKCLDNINLFVSSPDITVESLRDAIEERIYKNILEKGMEYFEELPISFKKKHPDLFLPESFPTELREKFCSGRLDYEDIRKNPQIKEILLTKNIGVGFGRLKYGQPMLARDGQRYVNPMWEKLSEQEIMDFAEEYGRYLNDVNADIFVEGQSNSEREKAIQGNIEQNIIDRKSLFYPEVPPFFKQMHPDMFLDSNAPDELKIVFYDGSRVNNKIIGDSIDFELIKDNPEWREFLKGKDLSRAFSREYDELFKRFDSATLMKLGTRNPETIEKMVQNHKEDVLESWYKSTGGKFVPHHVVMLNFPEGEIDNFLANGKRWSQLMQIDKYNLNDDGKTAILKAAYSMGVFLGNDEGFNKVVELFTGLPRDLSAEDYGKVIREIENNEEKKKIFEQAYRAGEDGRYVLKMNKQLDKQEKRNIRNILEQSDIPKILTPQKAHQIFDSFSMDYNPDFAKFFNENIEEILANPEYIRDIATMQRQFRDIVRTNAGRRLTLDVAQDYIRSIVYDNIEIGNEGVAEQAKIVGYSQKDFEAIQALYNEGETREFSSIPRIQGETNGYTYEMLRCDDPLTLTIGTLTDCCQEIHGAGQTSMEHSVVSPDGRVFCVKDNQGRLVAQSWFWRNQYTGCFDNIEIPHRIFKLYEKEHPDLGRKGLTTDVLEVYKKAAKELMQEDKRVYQELLENGTITQEQYDSLLLGKVTIGLGYNDIADAIQDDKTIHRETDDVAVKGTDRLPHPYTDAGTQYTIAEREGIVKSEQENLYVHQDEVSVFDGKNMSNTVLLTMKRMEQAAGRDNLAYLTERRGEEELPKSQKIINSISREYGLDPQNTKVIATSRIALIYSQDEDKVKIADLLHSPLKPELTEEQIQRAKKHIKYQIKKALNQIGITQEKLDISLLNEENQQIVQSIMQEIAKDKRGER